MHTRSGLEIRHGSSDGVDVSGTTVALTGEWPANFYLGGGKARLYIGQGATEVQQRELEAIFSGKKGGHLESLWDAVIDEWLRRNFLGRKTDPFCERHWPSNYAAIVEWCWEINDCIWRDVTSRDFRLIA